MTIIDDCQQNANNDEIHQPQMVHQETIAVAKAWVAKLANGTRDSAFVKPPYVRKVDAYRATDEGKAARAAKARKAYREKVEAQGKTLRPINVPDSPEKHAERQAQWRASKKRQRAKPVAKPGR